MENGKKVTLISHILRTIVMTMFMGFVPVTGANAAGPGGVTSNLGLWLKADAGANASTWLDQSGNGLDGTTFGGTTLTDNQLNFNPVYSFDGTDDAIQIVNNSTNGSPDPLTVGTNDLNIFTVTKPNGPNAGSGPQFIWADSRCTEEPGYGLFLDTNGANARHRTHGIFAPNVTDLTIPAINTDWQLFSVNRTGMTSTLEINNFASDNGTGTSIADLTGFKMNNQGLDPTERWLGRRYNCNNADFYNGEIAEHIVYPNTLTTTEIQQVQSYLSLKYGITLDAGGSDYLASNGSTKMWTLADNSGYTADIFGIGRDDNQDLDQRVSKSVNTGAVLTLATTADFTSANNDAGRTSLSNLQFLTIANNGGAITTQTTERNASTYGARITREWKADNTGTVGAVNLKFDDFNASYVLLTSTDGNFSTGAINAGALNANGEIAVTLTDGMYFTLAILNAAPTDIKLDGGDADTVAENTASGTAISALTTADTDTTDTHTYTLVVGAGDEDNAKFTISASTLKLNFLPDFENATDLGDTAGDNTYSIRLKTDDSNGGTYEKTFIITVSDTDADDPVELLQLIGTDANDTNGSTTNATAAQLNAIVGVSGAIAGNEAVYQTYIDDNAGSFASPATATEIQAMVTSVNGAVAVVTAAQIVIEAYADDNTSTAPSVQDYIDAGVTGVTTGNLDDVNTAVSGTNAAGVDTPAEIQTFVDTVVAADVAATAAQIVIEAYADDNTSTAPTVQDYIDAGVTGVTTGNLDDVNTAVSGTNAAGVDTPAEIQTFVDTVVAADVALAEIIEDITGNANNTAATATQINSIDGVTGAVAGRDYTLALELGTYVDPANPTPKEIQAVITRVNLSYGGSALQVVDDNKTIIRYGANVIDVLKNDIYTGKVTIKITEQPKHGSVEVPNTSTSASTIQAKQVSVEVAIGNDGEAVIIYTPNSDINNIIDSFKYSITDENNQVDEGEVFVDIQCASSQTSDSGDAMGTISTFIMMLMTLMSGLYFIRKEDERGEA